MAGTTKRVTNANIYVNGNNFLGRAEEVMVPEVKFKKSDHKALGMVGTFELFSGFDKMEGSIKWNSTDPDVYKIFASADVIKIQVRASMETHVSTGIESESKVVYYLTIQPSNISGVGFKQHDNVESTTNFSCTYIKMEVDDETIYEIDVLSNIWIVDGVDKLENYRANLGI